MAAESKEKYALLLSESEECAGMVFRFDSEERVPSDLPLSDNSLFRLQSPNKRVTWPILRCLVKVFLGN